MAGGICCILSNIVTQSIIIRCNRKNRQCQLNYGTVLCTTKNISFILTERTFREVLRYRLYYIIHIYALKGKLKQNKSVKMLIKLVHIHSPPFHKSLFDSGKNVSCASHVIIDSGNQVCVCAGNDNSVIAAIWPPVVVQFHRLRDTSGFGDIKT